MTSSTQEDLVPITFDELIPEDKMHKKDPKNISVLQNDACSTSRYVKIFMDSGASVLIIHDSFVRKNKFNIRKTSANKWSMMAESFLTLYKAEVQIKLPKINCTAHIFAKTTLLVGKKPRYP